MSTLYKKVNGSRISMSEEEVVDYNNNQPSPEERLQNCQNQRIFQLQKNRKSYQYKDIDLNGTRYIATKIASDNLSGIIQVMEDNGLTETVWLNSDDEQITLSLADAKALRTVIFTQQSFAYLAEADKKAEINDPDKTISEIEAINIDF